MTSTDRPSTTPRRALGIPATLALWLLGMALAVVASVMVYTTWFEAPPTTTTTTTPITARELTGTFSRHLIGPGCVRYSTDHPSTCLQRGSRVELGCTGLSELEGHLVRVTASDGELLAATRLGPGLETQVAGGEKRCTFPFSVAGLPEAPLYLIAIDSWTWEFTQSDLESRDFALRLVLADE